LVISDLKNDSYVEFIISVALFARRHGHWSQQEVLGQGITYCDRPSLEPDCPPEVIEALARCIGPFRMTLQERPSVEEKIKSDNLWASMQEGR